MGRYENEGSYDEAVQTLNNLLKEFPQLKPVAAQKIDELTRELSLKAKIKEEANDIKGELKTVAQEFNPLEKIKDGFLKFKVYFNKEQELFKALAESQHPKFMIVACSDSRVDPCRILGFELGDAFVVRNVANIVTPYWGQNRSTAIGSAIEYAVLHLKVEHLFVIGHSRCGGIKALLGSKEDGSDRFSEFIEEWVDSMRHASKKTTRAHPNSCFDEQCGHCEKEAVNYSLSNALTYPFVKDAVANGQVALHGGYYDFVRGSLEHWSVSLKFSEPEKFE